MTRHSVVLFCATGARVVVAMMAVIVIAVIIAVRILRRHVHMVCNRG